tara:strand:+ start:56 stop:466 length:411 start_codon:yes stop_codon:yes gene_type:complete
MSDKLPKVSIAVVGVVIAQIGGFIWWTAQQASTIANLEETVNVLTVENNATDRTNLIRDVEENTERIDEIIDYIVEVEEEGGETIDEIYEEFELVYDDMSGFLAQFNEIIELKARIKTLENTLEYLTRSPVHSDAR